MRLKQRLALRLPPRRSQAGQGSAAGRNEGSTSGSGWAHTRWVAPVGTPLGAVLGGNALPRGFDALVVPAASEVCEALGRLQPTPTDASDSGETAVHDPVRPGVVIDIETSGLGSTIVPFIAAAAWHNDDGDVQLEQWTLRVPGAEREFLGAFFERLDEVVRPGSRLLSYNGASFDLPRLRTRASRLVLDADALLGRHIDLVVPTRRVLKATLPNCRLSTIESKVLGLRRLGDMPGLEIAELWGRLCLVPEGAEPDVIDPFLTQDLAAAQVHNRGDVFGLFALATAVAQRLNAPRSLLEAAGAARHFRSSGDPQRSVSVLEPFLQSPAKSRGGTPAQRSDWVEAALLLADVHRTRGEHARAAQLWTSACEVLPGHIRAHEALAKHLEHRARQPDAALACAEASAAPCPRRLARLQKKVAAKLATKVASGADRSR